MTSCTMGDFWGVWLPGEGIHSQLTSHTVDGFRSVLFGIHPQVTCTVCGFRRMG